MDFYVKDRKGGKFYLATSLIRSRHLITKTSHGKWKVFSNESWPFIVATINCDQGEPACCEQP